ncbi:hypothetical protein H310_15241, partial [Aphanomyces invadans]
MENAPAVAESFTVQLHPHVRNFKGHSSGTSCDRMTITASTLEEFKMQLIDRVPPHLKREVEFDGDTPLWAPSEAPQRDDVNRFVYFYPPNKRTMELDSITLSTLRSWRNGKVWLHIHKYSNAVSSKARWVLVEKNLIAPAERDRAGAATTASLFDLKRRLRELHPNFQSHDINWHLWANAIQSSEAHLQEGMMTQPPPPHLIHLFNFAPISAEVQLTNLRRGVGIAASFNDNISNSVKIIAQAVKSLKR